MARLAIPNVGEDVEQLELLYMLEECKMLQALWKKFGSFLKVKSYTPAI